MTTAVYALGKNDPLQILLPPPYITSQILGMHKKKKWVTGGGGEKKAFPPSFNRGFNGQSPLAV